MTDRPLRLNKPELEALIHVVASAKDKSATWLELELSDSSHCDSLIEHCDHALDKLRNMLERMK